MYGVDVVLSRYHFRSTLLISTSRLRSTTLLTVRADTVYGGCVSAAYTRHRSTPKQPTTKACGTRAAKGISQRLTLCLSTVSWGCLSTATVISVCRTVRNFLLRETVSCKRQQPGAFRKVEGEGETCGEISKKNRRA